MNPTPEQLDAACLQGRIEAGWGDPKASAPRFGIIQYLMKLSRTDMPEGPRGLPPLPRNRAQFRPLVQCKYDLILSTFEACEHNEAQAARRLRCNRKTIHDALVHMGVLEESRNIIRLAIMLFMVVCLVGSSAEVPSSKPQASSLPPFPRLTAAAATATNSQKYLVWDAPAGVTSFAVYTGPARSQWTNRILITTNGVVYQAGIAYGVASLAAGEESGPAFWPSNRLAELWLTGYGAGLTQSTNLARLLTFTNKPPGNLQFWGVEDRTIGYQ